MSNGVEVIVATDRSARPLEPEFLRLLSSTVTRPITLAPHTLTNLMSMVLSSEQVVDNENSFMGLLRPAFATRTYYTTYNYKATNIKNGTAVSSNVKTVLANVVTEPVFTAPATELVKTYSHEIRSSPTLQTEVFSTQYTYYNTFLDGDQPLIVSSTQTVTNSLSGVFEDLMQLEPSEVFPTTNTYLKTVELTKTLTDGTDRHVTSTSDVITQVVVTDKPSRKATQTAITTNVTKTYFVTYTYFSTYLEGDKTKVKSDVSVSSDVTIEKFYIKPKKTETVTYEKIKRTETPIRRSSPTYPFSILATKTYLTTFTYFTTLLQGTDAERAETKITSRTKVVENVVTETISQQDLNAEYLKKLNSSLQRISGSIVATATLKQGDAILVTAFKNPPLKNSYQKYEIKPTKTNILDSELKTKWNDHVETGEMEFASEKESIAKPISTSVTKTKITLIKPSKTILINQPVAEALTAANQQEKKGGGTVRDSVIPTATSMTTNTASEHATHQTGVNKQTNLGKPNKKPASASVIQQKVKEDVKPPLQHSKTEEEDTKQTLNQTSVGGLLNLNVLGPVFNAMADLIHNKINKNADVVSRRNDTVTSSSEQEQNVKQPSSANVNPLLNFVNKLTSATTKATTVVVESKTKSTSPRTPVYIPVGSVAEDSPEFGQNQNRRVLITSGQPGNWHTGDKWKNLHSKNFEKIQQQAENPVILEGGIPISPGQVITTNSDVIIGRPGESGPRPPKFAVQNNIPLDMTPPPLGTAALILDADGDHYVGQHSTNQGVNVHFLQDDININPPPPITPPKKHVLEGQNLKSGRPFPNERLKGVPQSNGGHRGVPPPPNERHKGGPPIKGGNFKKNPNVNYDSGTIDLNPPPVPPPPVRTHDVHRPITVNHKPVHESHKHDVHDVRGVHDGHGDHDDHEIHDPHSIRLQFAENHHIENYITSPNINPTVLALPTVPAINQLHTGGIPLISTATPNLEAVNLESIVLVPTSGDKSINPNVVDRSTGHPFLVNIQPSQVANIVIPHGSSTALILSDGKQHSLKGEVIDDPSPHPGPETVGFVGSEPVLKLNDDVTSALPNEIAPAVTVNLPKTNSKLNDDVLDLTPPQPPVRHSNAHHNTFNNNVKGTSQQHSQGSYLNLGQQQQQQQQTVHFVQQLPVAVQEGSSPLATQHQANGQTNGDGIQTFGIQHQNSQIHNVGGVAVNHNVNFNAQNYVNGNRKPDAAENYRREPNLNADGPNLYISGPVSINSQSAFDGSYFQQIQGNRGQQSYPPDADGLYTEQIRFKEGQNVENPGGISGVYIGVPPPPPPTLIPSLPEVVHFHEAQSSNQHESLINHQSGSVHDVPITQILASNDHQESHHPKEILGGQVPNSENLIPPEVNLGPHFFDGQTHVKHPPPKDFDQDLSPPPLPHRPPFPGQSPMPQQPPKAPQRHRPHPPPQPVPTPLEFMIPPPEAPNRLKVKPQLDQHSRPAIPIGAIAPLQNFGHVHQEDMVIVPPKIRPGLVDASFVNNIKHKHQIPPNTNVFYDLDVSDTSGNYDAENGEEMQESNIQPMFPGQVINDVLRVNRNFSRPGDHQNIRPSKQPGITETIRNYTSNGEKIIRKPAIAGPTTSREPEIKNQGSKSTHNVAHQVGSSNNQKTVVNTGGQNRPSETDAHKSDLVKEPNKFGTPIQGQVFTSDGGKKDQSLSHHKGFYEFDNHRHKQSEAESVRHEQTSSKSPSDLTTKTGSQNANGGVKAQGATSNSHFFIGGSESPGSRRPVQGIRNQGESLSDAVTLFTNDKSNLDPVGYPSVLIETISKDPYFGSKDNGNKKPVELPPPRNRVNELHRDRDGGHVHSETHNNRHKQQQPGRYDPSNQPFGTKLHSGVHGGVQNFTRPPHNQEETTGNRPHKIPHRNRVPVGGHAAGATHVSGHKNGGGNVQKRPYLPFDSLGQSSTKIRRPVGFTRPNADKEDVSKVFSEEGMDRDQAHRVQTTDQTNKQVSNEGNQNHRQQGSAAAGTSPSATYINKTETTSFDISPNHNYGNRTINFYDSKPTFDVTKVHKTYNNNKLALDAENWFASNFKNKNTNNHNYNNATIDLPQTDTRKNVTQPVPNLATGASDLQITLMTPPKPSASDSKKKPEEVMGLSPPPLERPRRPQTPHRPQRPKPHFGKFEIPNASKSPPSPPVENDFPPVRSPEFNKKPFKPQDIFPPRLPDNFVHHLPDYPIRVPSKPRLPERPERPVTSLPIDVPTTNKAEPEKPWQVSNGGIDLGETTVGEDSYFAGSEINGHSKPIHREKNEESIINKRPPPLVFPSTTKQIPVFPNKSLVTSPYQATTSRTRTSERPRPESSTPQIKQSVVISSKRDDVPATPVIDILPTKTSTFVTPTTTRPHKEWIQDAAVIAGSETTFESNQFSNHRLTPTISSVGMSKPAVTSPVDAAPTTAFGDEFTEEVDDKVSNPATIFEGLGESSDSGERTSVAATPVIWPTRTTTLTVTTTLTTVVQSGRKPVTTTIVLTKTLISTVINKVTETKTLVKPTTSTLTHIHTVSKTQTPLIVQTVMYPSKTKFHTGGTMKPEIFVADPHAKDTMTISVSSSMSKNGSPDNNNHNNNPRPEDEVLDQTDNESIMVVVSNKHPQDADLSDEDKGEVSDEDNDVIHSRVMVGGVFDANVDKEFQESSSSGSGSSKDDECFPGCKAKKNELCQRIKGALKCICRPGFARMFPDRPCRPTYTYKVKLALEKLGPEPISYEKNVAQSNSADMAKLTSVTKEGLDRMIMQSELRDIYHGLVVNGFQGNEQKTLVNFYVQLSENTDEDKLMDIFKKTLKTSNYSLGGTELFAAREADNLDAEDFNECVNPKFHDCSEHARCFNLKGTYTCSCKEGYTDMSENALFPGRVCSDAIGCEYCGYHGACYPRGDGQITCECFQWYSGERCNINLKVLLIALATIGVILLALLLVCGILTCLNKRNKNFASSRNNGYLRYRGPSSHSIDRRAMISDTSSESSIDNVPYLNSPPSAKSGTMSGKKKAVLRQVKAPVPRTLPPPGAEQRDRSVTVMIPRAKYRPPPHLSSHLTMSTFSPEKHLPKPTSQIATEQKLISYLDGNTSTREERTIVTNKNQNNKQDGESHKTYDYKSASTTTTATKATESPKTLGKDGGVGKVDSRVFEYEYKMSNMSFSEETNSAERRSAKNGDDRFRRHSDSTHMHTDSNRQTHFRKYSAGALVSAGYEVSAKVGMHQLNDDVTEDDQWAISNTHTMKSNRSQFTTLNRTGDHKTMSEARSYDETTVHPQTRSLKTNYSGSSPSSRSNNDEGHTMIERDLGSTFIMPESQLFKPEADRGSDISNFDSL